MLLLFCLLTSLAQAEVIIHFGPVSSGTGGPNPISIPPIEPVEYEVVWLTQQKMEWSFGIIPGLVLYGKRNEFSNGCYISAGGGFVFSENAAGPGVYAAFGWENCGWFCYNIEYKQALGLASFGLTSPYALRIGVTLFKK